MNFTHKIFLFLIIFGFLSSSAQKREKDSLLLALKNTNNDSLKCIYLNFLIEYESDNTIWPLYNAKLKVISERGVKTTDPLKKVFYLEALSNAIANDGFLKQQKGQFSGALADYRKSIDIKFDINDRSGVANNLVNIGYIYYAVGDYAKAANYYNKCLKIQEELKDKEGAALTLVNLGNVFLRQNDTLKFLELLNRALKYRQETKDQRGIANCYNSLSMIEAARSHNEVALEYSYKALKIFQELDYKDGLGNANNNLGGIYRNMGQMDKALSFFNKALKINTEIKDYRSLSNSYLNIARIHELKNRNVLALELYKEALKYAKISGEIKEIKIAAEAFYLFEKNQGNEKESKTLFLLFTKMKDSLEKKTVIKLAENTDSTSLQKNDIEEVIPQVESKGNGNNNLIIIVVSIILISGFSVIYFIFKKRK